MNHLISLFWQDPDNTTRFQEIVAQFIIGKTDQELRSFAEHFEVSVQTLPRWGNGISTPLRSMRILIVDYIYQQTH